MAGCSVLDLSSAGKGIPDLAVRLPSGRVQFVEVKTEKGTLRPAQEAIRQAWDVRIVRTVDEAMALVARDAKRNTDTETRG